MDLPDRELVMLGVDFGTASLPVRESLSFTPADAGALLHAAAAIPGLEEAVVVSTCNRTEFYLVITRGSDAVTEWLHLVGRRRPHAPIGDGRCEAVRSHGLEAARHLLRVACGLESALLGDAHIVGQLKQALAVASRAGTLGPFLNRAFRHAFAAFATARRQTDIGRGHPSLGSAVAGMIADRAGAAPHVLILGAGVAARDIGRQLLKWNIGTLTVTNRTASRASDFASQIGAALLPWAVLDDAIDRADVVVAATSAPRSVLDAAGLRRALARRGARPLLIVDVGVPRNVEPVAGVSCVTVDDIAARRDEALAGRRRAVPCVEAIIDRELDRWGTWLWARPAEALIKRVFLEEERARLELVDRLISSGPPASARDLDRLIAGTWRRILYTHARDMRAWLQHGLPNDTAVAAGLGRLDAQRVGNYEGTDRR